MMSRLFSFATALSQSLRFWVKMSHLKVDDATLIRADAYWLGGFPGEWFERVTYVPYGSGGR
jgi:hypothetical protein